MKILSQPPSKNKLVEDLSITQNEDRGLLRVLVKNLLGSLGINDYRIINEVKKKHSVSIPVMTYNTENGLRYLPIVKILGKGLKNNFCGSILSAWDNYQLEISLRG